MTKHYYELGVTLKTDIPADVLVEHVGYALRAVVDPERRSATADAVKVKLLGHSIPGRGRQHPFDGPEVNDDMPEPAFRVGDTVEILSGRNKDDWADTPIIGQVPRVPEYAEVLEVELDLDDIIGQVYTAIGEDFPHLAELFKDKREEHEVRRSASITDPLAEGEWDLGNGDNVGEDL